MDPHKELKSFEETLRRVMSAEQNPTIAQVRFICSQLESYDQFGHCQPVIKNMAMAAIMAVKEIKELEQCEDLLRIYQIVGKYSRSMGARAIYDRLEADQQFRNSLKYHLLWAESYAAHGDLAKFKFIIDTAAKRLSHMPKVSFEAGFRDLADKFFPKETGIFEDESDLTINLFKGPVGAEAGKFTSSRRRRSSIAFLQRCAGTAEAPPVQPQQRNPAYGPKTHTALRAELIDRPDYIAISMEEYRAALQQDQQDMEDVMDITHTQNFNRIVTAQAPVVIQSVPAPVHVEEPEHVVMASKRRTLSTLIEDSVEEKKNRIFSPAKENPIIKSRLSKNDPTSSHTSPLVSGESFSEDKIYNKAAALFSDTVDMNRIPAALEDEAEESIMPVVQKQAFNACEVFVDPEESARNPPIQNENAHSAFTRSTLNRDRAPLRPLDDGRKEPEVMKKDISDNIFGSGIPREKQLMFEDDDEPTLSGVKFIQIGVEKKLDRGIITSTPAPFAPTKPTHEDFFAAFEEQEAKEVAEKERKRKEEEDKSAEIERRRREKEEQEAFIPTPPAVVEEEKVYVSAFQMRRRSIVQNAAPAPVVAAAAAAAAPVGPPMKTYTNRSMENALGKMTLASSPTIVDENAVSSASTASMPMEEGGDNDDVDFNKTGVGLVDEEVTSVVNPWDINIRKKIMASVGRCPVDQHDYQTPSPKMSSGREVCLGGELIQIDTLIGQGGFAKVYRCTTEDGKIMALKYEIPPCPWEVYICDQVKRRLESNGSSSARKVIPSIMQITDAYIFSNASVLLNEYHGLGTLLDVANKMNDPTSCIIVFIAYQLAKILREVHNVNIIHGDVKPDNFMVLSKLPEKATPEELLALPAVKLIDWGRAIDMTPLAGQTFRGKAGTAQFDCPEMKDDRPWTYQTDYFGFVGSMHVIIFNKYCDLVKTDNEYKMNASMKRRLACRDVMSSIFTSFMNIPSCSELPSWDKALQELSKIFTSKFDVSEWRQAAQKFNSSLPS